MKWCYQAPAIERLNIPPVDIIRREFVPVNAEVWKEFKVGRVYISKSTARGFNEWHLEAEKAEQDNLMAAVREIARGG